MKTDFKAFLADKEWVPDPGRGGRVVLISKSQINGVAKISGVAYESYFKHFKGILLSVNNTVYVFKISLDVVMTWDDFNKGVSEGVVKPVAATDAANLETFYGTWTGGF